MAVINHNACIVLEYKLCPKLLLGAAVDFDRLMRKRLIDGSTGRIGARKNKERVSDATDTASGDATQEDILWHLQI